MARDFKFCIWVGHVMTDYPLVGVVMVTWSNFYISNLENFVGVLVQSTNSATVSLWITPTTVERIMSECTSLLYVG